MGNGPDGDDDTDPMDDDHHDGNDGPPPTDDDNPPQPPPADDDIPQIAEAMFMDEPSCAENHRGNIMDNDFTDIGAGMAVCGDVFIYTEVFATFSASDLRADPNEHCS
jgi:hypothetical protein